MAKSNPNKVNQYTNPDPRQSLFLSNYLDPKSETFSNCLQSALKAGYSQEYAENITAKTPAWFKEKVGKLHLTSKAEKNLDGFLDSDDERIAFDATKFVLERLKKEDYSLKNDHNINHSGQINIELTQYNEDQNPA